MAIGSSAVVLAVLARRQTLRRHDRWAPVRLRAHQDRALTELRRWAMRRSVFYRRFHAGQAERPLVELPVLTKVELMQQFDEISTRPDVRLADLERYLAGPDPTGLFRGRWFVCATAGTTASARIDTVVMDKTGTLTQGEPEVTDVVAVGLDQAELLAVAAAVERASEHPLARAIVAHAEAAGVARLDTGRFENVPGHGAIATVEGRRVAVGNPRLLDREGVALGALTESRERLAGAGRTTVVVAVDGHPAGVIALADAPRPTAAAAVAALHELGIQVVMLTGDNQATARRVADQLGIDQVIAEVLPADKSAQITRLQDEGRRVAMVGDGVNDAPALAQADLGVAIGAGTDVAIETADVVLMRSDPLDVATALRIGRGTLRKMRQNLGWAIGYNAVALPIAAGVFEPAFGLVLRPEIAALSMSGSSLLVAVNALLLKRLRLPRAPTEEKPATTAAEHTVPA